MAERPRGNESPAPRRLPGQPDATRPFSTRVRTIPSSEAPCHVVVARLVQLDQEPLLRRQRVRHALALRGCRRERHRGGERARGLVHLRHDPLRFGRGERGRDPELGRGGDGSLGAIGAPRGPSRQPFVQRSASRAPTTRCRSRSSACRTSSWCRAPTALHACSSPQTRPVAFTSRASRRCLLPTRSRRGASRARARSPAHTRSRSRRACACRCSSVVSASTSPPSTLEGRSQVAPR